MQGTLHFDFSGGDRPGEDPIVMSDVRTLNVLFNLSLVTKLDKHRYLKLIDTLQGVCIVICCDDEIVELISPWSNNRLTLWCCTGSMLEQQRGWAIQT